MGIYLEFVLSIYIWLTVTTVTLTKLFSEFPLYLYLFLSLLKYNFTTYIIICSGATFDFKLVCSFVFCNPKCNQWKDYSWTLLVPKYETSLPLPKWPMDWSRTERWMTFSLTFHARLNSHILEEKHPSNVCIESFIFFGDHFLFKQSLRGGSQCARKLQNWCRSCNFWWKGKSLRKAMVPLTKQRAASYYVAAKRQNFIEVSEERKVFKEEDWASFYIFSKREDAWLEGSYWGFFFIERNSSLHSSFWFQVFIWLFYHLLVSVLIFLI